jgi:hypothetical protein
MLAVPTRGRVSHHTVSALILELNRIALDDPDAIEFQEDQLSVARCRNRIVRKFLAGKKEWLVMVDDDVVPPLGFLDHLVADGPPYGVRGWPYPTWNSAYGFHLAVYNFEGPPYNSFGEPIGFKPAALEVGWTRVHFVGTGCIAIHRDVLLDQEEPFRLRGDWSEDAVFACDQWEEEMPTGCFTDGRIADHVRTLALGYPLNQQNIDRG